MTTAVDYLPVLACLGRRRQTATRHGTPMWWCPCPVCGDRCPTHLAVWIDDRGHLKAKCYGGKCSAMPRRAWWLALLESTGTTAGQWFGDRGLPRGRLGGGPADEGGGVTC